MPGKDELYMQEIDRKIQNIDNIICTNIDLVDMAEITRAFVSQNFLAHSRNLVEHIMVKAYGEGQDIRVDWDSIRASETYVKHDSKYLFIT